MTLYSDNYMLMYIKTIFNSILLILYTRVYFDIISICYILISSSCIFCFPSIWIVLFVIYVTTILRSDDVLLHYVTLVQEGLLYYKSTLNFYYEGIVLLQHHDITFLLRMVCLLLHVLLHHVTLLQRRVVLRLRCTLRFYYELFVC